MKVCSYLRISTVSQIDNTSIDDQREKIDLYCKLHNIELVREFVDEGWSAKSTNRPSYTEMIDFISNEENNINAIIVFKSDRIHRSLVNLLLMIEDLQKINVNFISLTEQFDTSTAQGMLFLQMLGSFSEFERKLIGERTKGGRIAKGKKQLYPGGRVPYGYTLIDDKLEVNENEANIVKEIFKLRSKGKTTVEIGKKFNMSKQRISYILQNKAYLGTMSYDGKVEQNKINLPIPRIISDYMYRKVN